MNHGTAQRPVLGSAEATRLLEAVASDPAAPVAAAIQGAGGYGKTALLAEFARIYRSSGTTVCDASGLPDATAAGDVAVLIDDAHLLDDASLRSIKRLAEDSSAKLIITYRPWPRPTGLGELVFALGRTTAPIQLDRFGPEAIRHQVSAAMGSGADGNAEHSTIASDTLGRLCDRTGGVPRLVARVLDVVDLSALATGQRVRLPRTVYERFQVDFDQFDAVSRQCVTAVALGATPHPALLAALLEVDSTVTSDAMAAIRASGLANSDDTLIPLAREAAVVLTSWEQRLAILRKLVTMQLQRGGPVRALVEPLLDFEAALMPDDAMAAAFAAAGDEALPESPSQAVRLFDAAMSAGARPGSIAARRAHAAAAAGDLDEALRAADKVLVDETAENRALGIQVSAAVMAHRGLLSHVADLCGWSAEHVRWPGDLAYAVVALLGTGRATEARELLGASSQAGPPTSLSGATRQLADGMNESVSGSAAAALSTLLRSASLVEPVGHGMLVPVSPAAIASFVAINSGELDVAESAIDRALDTRSGGPLLHTRHALLASWIPMLRGDTIAARTKLDSVTAQASVAGLGVRDRLMAVAIEAGIANRDNDMTALGEVRGRARRAIAEHPIDLFTLLPIGELAVAAARLRDQEWLLPYLRQAWSLLDSLGNPALWSAPLHWKCLQSAIVLEQAEQASTHARALEGMAEHNPLAAALAEAAQVWLRLLHGDVGKDEAERAARNLHSAGLVWDGARLAGQAAIRTTDRKAMLALLECARSLQGKAPRPQKHPASGQAEGGDPMAAAGAELLSGREREVAELVLAGLTYKQVGSRLFISAKTVEHHIGRIKQRLGCTDREQLLAQLRVLMGA